MKETTKRKLDFQVLSAVLVKDKIALSGVSLSSSSSFIGIFSFESLKPVHQVNTHKKSYDHLGFAELEKSLVACSKEGICVYSVMPSGRFLESQTIDLQSGKENKKIVFELSGRNLFVIEKDSEFKIFEKGSGVYEQKFELNVSNPVMDLCYIKSERKLLFAFTDKLIFFSLATKKFVQSISEMQGPLKGIKMHHIEGKSQALLLNNGAQGCLAYWAHREDQEEVEIEPGVQLFSESATSVFLKGNFAFIGSQFGKVSCYAMNAIGGLAHLSTSQPRSSPSVAILSRETKQSFLSWNLLENGEAFAFEISKEAIPASAFAFLRIPLLVIVLVLAMMIAILFGKS